jgi:hypothetical protein
VDPDRPGAGRADRGVLGAGAGHGGDLVAGGDQAVDGPAAQHAGRAGDEHTQLGNLLDAVVWRGFVEVTGQRADL